MLELAYIHKERLNELWQKNALDPKYKYYFAGGYENYEKEIDNNNWNNLSFVSLDINNRKILGFLSASIDRKAHKIDQLYLRGFDTDSKNFTFMIDILNFTKNLFSEYGFRKIEFSVVVGNPAEKYFDKLVKKNGGRIVGILKKSVRLMDGRLYDYKMYEIFNPELEAEKYD